MNFAHPWAWLLLLLLIPVVLLYRLGERAASEVVGTGMFWQKALAEERTRRRWQPWRTKFSLAIHALIVILLTVAAAGPQIPASRRTVLVIDNSATMRATDVQPHRLDAAKEIARRMIESLRACDEIAIVTTCPNPAEIRPLTGDLGLLHAAVDSIETTDSPADLDRAVKLARGIRNVDATSQIVVISDCNSSEAARRAVEGGACIYRVGTAAGNMAASSFTARRLPTDPAKCEVFVEVRNLGNGPAEGKITIAAGATDNSPCESFRIAKDGRWQKVFTLDLPSASRLTARLEPGDAYVFDNSAALDVPAAPPRRRVALVADAQSPLNETLAAHPRVELASGDAKAIRVYDGKLPEQLPDGPALVFSPTKCDLWDFGPPVLDATITQCDSKSPVAVGLDLPGAYLSESREIRVSAPFQAVARPILWAGDKPLGYAIDRPQGRVVVVGGNLATSNLASNPGFPRLLAQVLDWLDGMAVWRDEVFQASRDAGEGRGGPADLRVPADVGAEASHWTAVRPWPPLWPAPAVLAVLLAMIEWCLYQRRWTS